MATLLHPPQPTVIALPDDTSAGRTLREQIIAHFAACKASPREHEIALAEPGYVLRPLGSWCLDQPEIIRLIADSRRRNQIAFPAIFNVTYNGTLAWFHKRVIDDPERLLYGVFNADGCLVAHSGYATFDWSAGDGEIDNVMRCDDTAPKGLMRHVTAALLDHAYRTLGLSSMSLRVFGDNYRAIRLYMHCGFVPVESIPLTCVFNEGGLAWQQQESFQSGSTFRIFLRMKHDRR
jgi:RimJ/RimL family protein N-acetyltransferase